MLACWREIGSFVSEQLQLGRGVRMEKLGTFTFDDKGALTFSLAESFSRRMRVRFERPTLNAQTLTTKLNFSKIANSIQAERDAVDEFVFQFTDQLARVVQEGENVRVTIHPVCNLLVKQGTFRCSFLPSFHETLNQKKTEAQKTLGSAGYRETSQFQSVARTLGKMSRTKPSRSEQAGDETKSVASKRSTSSSRMLMHSPRSVNAGDRTGGDDLGLQAIQRVKDAIIERGGTTGIHAVTRFFLFSFSISILPSYLL